MDIRGKKFVVANVPKHPTVEFVLGSIADDGMLEMHAGVMPELRVTNG